MKGAFMIRLKATPENIAKLKKCHPNVVINEIVASVPGTLGEYMIDRLDENIAKQFGTLITPPVTSASQLKPLSQSTQDSTQEKPNAAISLWQGLVSFEEMMRTNMQTLFDQYKDEVQPLLEKYKAEMQPLLDQYKEELVRKMQDFSALFEKNKQDFQQQVQHALNKWTTETQHIQAQIATLKQTVQEIESILEEGKRLSNQGITSETNMLKTCQKAIQDHLQFIEKTFEIPNQTPDHAFVIASKNK